jgi:signal peptidase I
MFKKMKLKKLIKKILNRKRQMEWIRKKRKLVPEPVEKRLVSNIEAADELVRKFEKKNATLEESEKLLYEIEHNFKLHFDKYKQNALAELFDELWLVVTIALILKFFVIGSFRVPTGSMVNTIEIGDNLFVAMFVYGLTFPFAKSQFVEFSDPERGEIITFTEPNPEGKALVKRVVGIPGDTIMITGTDLYVNGKKLEREYIEKVKYTSSKGEKVTASQFLEKTPDGLEYKVIYNDAIYDFQRTRIEETYCKFCNRSFTVPQRNYFVMGDNRDDSLDSRYWGFVPRENLQGKPLFVWFSVQFGESIFDVVDLRLKRIGHIFQ